MMSFGTIILAAGGSTRMGDLGPKQLLLLGGISLIQRAINTAKGTGGGPVVVVLGAYADEIKVTIPDNDVETIFNHHWQEGMGTSISAGVTHISKYEAVEGVLIMTADQPWLFSHSLKSLVERSYATGRPIAATSYSGDRLGTPAFFARQMFTDLANLPPQRGAKQLINAYPELVSGVPSTAPSDDIDTPDKYREALRQKWD